MQYNTKQLKPPIVNTQECEHPIATHHFLTSFVLFLNPIQTPLPEFWMVFRFLTISYIGTFLFPHKHIRRK